MGRLASYSNGNTWLSESNTELIYVFLALAGSIIISNAYVVAKDRIKNYRERKRAQLNSI
jgi:hypothetical protein